MEKNREIETFTLKDVCCKNSREEIILGIPTDNKLTFDSHVRKICKKILSTVKQTLKNINTSRQWPQKMIFNAMTKSQFSYCL